MNYNLETIEGCTEAINKDPRKEVVGSAYVLRARLYALKQNYNPAINDKETGLKYLEQYLIGNLPVEVDKVKLKEYIAQEYFIAAEYCRMIDSYERAIKHYDKSFSLGKKEDFDLFHGRAWCKSKLQLYREAHLDCDIAIEIAKKNALPWQKGHALFMIRGGCKLALGDIQGANIDFDYAKRLDPKNM